MAIVVVTVGMGAWPFDRLVRAADLLAGRHDVFVQHGTGAPPTRAAGAAYIAASELQRRLESADVVITHAGNTVRLVQRLGKVPIAVAREHARGEMGNDHQVRFLRGEEQTGPVLAVWDDLAGLADLVDRYEAAAAAVRDRPVPPATDPVLAWKLVEEALAERRRPRRHWRHALDRVIRPMPREARP